MGADSSAKSAPKAQNPKTPRKCMSILSYFIFISLFLQQLRPTLEPAPLLRKYATSFDDPLIFARCGLIAACLSALIPQTQIQDPHLRFVRQTDHHHRLLPLLHLAISPRLYHLLPLSLLKQISLEI